MPQGSYRLPFIKHNHDPAIIACPDGSLLASWFSSNCGEGGRCVGLAFARLELGATRWSDAAVDLDVQVALVASGDFHHVFHSTCCRTARNVARRTCCRLAPARVATAEFTSHLPQRSTGLLVQFSGINAAGDTSGFYRLAHANYMRTPTCTAIVTPCCARSNIAGLARQSTDCGRSWSPPDFVWPEHGLENNIVVTAIESREGEVLVPCDHWGTFDLPSPPILLGDQSVVAHAPSFSQIMNRSAWRRAPSGGGA
jgi:hypothetical protein